MLVCVFLQFCTRDRRCSAHPAFPAPSILREAKRSWQNSGKSRREIADLYLEFTSLRPVGATRWLAMTLSSKPLAQKFRAFQPVSPGQLDCLGDADPQSRDNVR